MYTILFFIVIILVVFYISKNNYKNRATSIKENLFEFGDEILKIYYNLSETQKNTFQKSLNSKEAVVLNNLINQSYQDNSNFNINNIQNTMFIMEELIKKL